jgi:hypothetical protein
MAGTRALGASGIPPECGMAHAANLGDWGGPRSQSVGGLSEAPQILELSSVLRWMLHVFSLMHFLTYLANGHNAGS